jgi:hypothetical protein
MRDRNFNDFAKIIGAVDNTVTHSQLASPLSYAQTGRIEDH